jgi:hypothetical protein
MCFLLVKDLDLDPKLENLRIRILNKISDPARAPVELQFLKLVILGQKDRGSRIRINEFKYGILKQKFFISSRKYDPGCSSHNPDSGSRGQKGPGTRIQIRNTAFTHYSPKVFINLTYPFKNKCVPESEVDPLLLAGRILGYAVEPVLLHRALHQQQRPGEQRETDEVRSSLNGIKHQERKIGAVCMRLAADLALFACGWRLIRRYLHAIGGPWRYLHAAGGQSGVICMRLALFACGWRPIWCYLHAAVGHLALLTCGWRPIWRYLHAAGGPSGVT